MIRCDAPGCVIGLVHRAKGWADPCNICGGTGRLSLSAIAKRIGENESTLRRILKPHRKMRAKVCQRICGKLIDLIEPAKSKQPELFT